MFEPKDHYWKLAKKEGFRSRAAYKLIEIQKRFQILKKGDHVLDLGCAPGGWLQVIAPQVGTGGKVVGLDRLPVKTFHFQQVTVIRGNINDKDILKEIKGITSGRRRYLS